MYFPNTVFHFGHCTVIHVIAEVLDGWLVGFGFSGPLGQYFSQYRAESQREGERREKG